MKKSSWTQRIRAASLAAGLFAPASAAAQSGDLWNSRPPQEWTADAVKQWLLLDDRALSMLVNNSAYVSLDSQDAHQAEINRQYQAAAQAMGVEPVPALYVDRTNQSDLSRWIPEAISFITNKDSRYILLSPAALSQWNSRQLGAILEHELAQYKLGHVTAENIAAAHNDPSRAYRMKFDADQAATGGPGGACGSDLVEALRIQYHAMESLYLRKFPDQTAIDFRRYYEEANAGDERFALIHPPLEARIDALLQNTTIPRKCGIANERKIASIGG